MPRGTASTINSGRKSIDHSRRRGALTFLAPKANRSCGYAKNNRASRHSSGGTLPSGSVHDRGPARRIVIGLGLAGIFCWSYWPVLADLWRIWGVNDDYSAGKLVLPAAIYITWCRREQLRRCSMSTCWWGLALLVLSQAVRLTGDLLSYGSLQQYSIAMAVPGVVLLLFGWPITRQLTGVFLFLLLLAPFPRRVDAAISLPLQRFATSSAVFSLELLGYLVTRHGNVLELSPGHAVSIAEACSGLRMLTAFIMVGSALALVTHRPVWQKLCLVAVTLPIAVLTNTLRITSTALFSERFGAQASEKVFHDYAGLIMMPLAFMMLLVLLRLMRGVAAPAFPTMTGAR